jgi:hypothetical protein
VGAHTDSAAHRDSSNPRRFSVITWHYHALSGGAASAAGGHRRSGEPIGGESAPISDLPATKTTTWDPAPAQSAGGHRCSRNPPLKLLTDLGVGEQREQSGSPLRDVVTTAGKQLRCGVRPWIAEIEPV